MSDVQRRWFHCDDCGEVWSMRPGDLMALFGLLPTCPECGSLNVERGVRHAS